MNVEELKRLTAMKLTRPQFEELKRIARFKEPQTPARRQQAMVQNSLRAKGLVRYFNDDGHTPSVIEIMTSNGCAYQWCEITPTGRAFLRVRTGSSIKGVR